MYQGEHFLIANEQEFVSINMLQAKRSWIQRYVKKRQVLFGRCESKPIRAKKYGNCKTGDGKRAFRVAG